MLEPPKLFRMMVAMGAMEGAIFHDQSEPVDH